MHLYQNKNFEAFLLDDNCIYFKYFKNAEIDVEDVEKGFQLHDQFKVNEEVCRIIHSEPSVQIDKQARELLEHSGRPAKAEAYIIPSLAQKIIFNFYSCVRKSKHPVKAFDSLDKAMYWLKSFG